MDSLVFEHTMTIGSGGMESAVNGQLRGTLESVPDISTIHPSAKMNKPS